MNVNKYNYLIKYLNFVLLSKSMITFNLTPDLKIFDRN